MKKSVHHVEEGLACGRYVCCSAGMGLCFSEGRSRSSPGLVDCCCPLQTVVFHTAVLLIAVLHTVVLHTAALHTAVLNHLLHSLSFGAAKSLTGVCIPAMEDTGLVGWYLEFTEGWGMVRNSCPLLSWV